MRTPQRSDGKGSLRWMQRLQSIPDRPLDRAIRDVIGLPESTTITWKSPVASDEHAEYRDAAFLKAVGLDRLHADLERFWPARGPQWDGLATTSDDKVILVEAKAHAGELASSCAAGSESRAEIERALDGAKAHFGAGENADWTRGFYQYANRLAHLKFLRDHGVDAHLVFVYFINDLEMRGPKSREEWINVLEDCYATLGIDGSGRHAGVHEVFVDVSTVRE